MHRESFCVLEIGNNTLNVVVYISTVAVTSYHS